MNRFAKILLSATAVALVATAVIAADPKASAPAAAKPVKDYVIAEVNGEKINYSDLEKTWNDLFPGEGKAPAMSTFGDAIRDNVVRGVVSEKLMLKEAEAAKLGESAAVKEKLAQIRNQLMVQELLQKNAGSAVTEGAVKQAYNEQIKKVAGKEEVHARHILVEKKEDADAIYKKIKAGGDFAKIAKEKSSDKGSAERGGDLGYFQKEQMVPEFAEAAFKLKKGEVSAPVKSAFGWHVIKAEDRRKLPVPTLEEARPQIEQQLQGAANQAYILKLLKSAKLKYFTPEGKEAPFPAEQKAPASQGL
jgi:peptidyl-prolyl cis-trans isomerase C